MENQEVIQVCVYGQDAIRATQVQGLWDVQVWGCLKLKERVAEMLSQEPDLTKWPTKGPFLGHIEMLIRELVLKAQSKWAPPVTHPEVCHCRAISTQTVDEIILAGAKSVEMISKRTTAGTSCGTCVEDLGRQLHYRQGVE